jgi:hypothetical protein
MNTREQAIAEIVALADAHKISIAELTSALGRQEIEANKKDAFTLTRVFSYLGGIFILAGLTAYITLSWHHLNSAARILITLGPGIICLVLAVTMALQPTRRSSVAILVFLSAVFQTIGLFVAVYEFSTSGGDIRVAALLIFGVLGAQYGLLFAKVKRTSFLFFTIYFSIGAFVNMCSLLNLTYNLIEFICGLSLLALSYGLQRTPYNSICGFGYFVGSVVLLWMAFDIVWDTSFEILYLAIAAFMLYASTIVGSRSILITSAIALFSYISYFTGKHFMDSIGWPICLIIVGVVFFGMAHLVLRLNKKLVSSNHGTIQ